MSLDLEAIKARCEEAGRCLALLNEWSTDAHCQWLVERTALAVADVPALVAEVERLRAVIAGLMRDHPVVGRSFRVDI